MTLVRLYVRKVKSFSMFQSVAVIQSVVSICQAWNSEVKVSRLNSADTIIISNIMPNVSAKCNVQCFTVIQSYRTCFGVFRRSSGIHLQTPTPARMPRKFFLFPSCLLQAMNEVAWQKAMTRIYHS